MSRRHDSQITDSAPEMTTDGHSSGYAMQKTATKVVNGPMGIDTHDHKIERIPEPKQKSSFRSWLSPPLDSYLLRFSNLLNLVTWMFYFYCCVKFIYEVEVTAQQQSWPLWMAMAGEFAFLLQDTSISFDVLFSWFFGVQVPGVIPRYHISGTDVPSVDVVVTCCGEDPLIIINTAAAIVTQDYPANRLRVFILDDAGDDQLRDLVNEFRRKYSTKGLPSLSYLARKKTVGSRHYYKSGNLHFGFEHTGKLESGSELFATVDADHIATRQWLRTMVPHMLIDDRVALACPPQV